MINTWECSQCCSIAHKREMPGGECSNPYTINTKSHRWAEVERDVQWQCSTCGAESHRRERPLHGYGGDCSNSINVNIIIHSWKSAN